ncbi:ABC transporter substrate-binding protein [Hoeflea sp.]|uniref:ABC transporter substrate-binding protein n=1 Tax=Hoeflea sp. TaxID=1940281 RepID=UPI001990076D|nr:ABC transporter substrate-binding protein [Hoeflea sp.]MBC7284446.1 ABC transporter substrate-binding protein [Hoeflea sp.]
MHKITQIRKRLVSAALAALAMASPLVATAQNLPSGTLTVAMTASDVPDWAGMPDQGFEGHRFVGYSLYEGLVAWDLSTSDQEVDIIPGLAQVWYIDPENPKRWIFELRGGVTFHDGCVWNAEAAVWNYQRLIDEAHPGFNQVDFARARSRTSTIAKVEKIDDMTFALHTTDVESLFPYNLVYVLMVSPCAYKAAGNDRAAYAAKPSGTGPYVFGSVVPGERLELLRNEAYWNPDRIPQHERLVLLPMPEATTRAAALLSGQVDFVEAPSPDMIPALEAAGMTVVLNEYPHYWPYRLNVLQEPFSDVRVRQAANYAINREEMVALLNGTAVPAFGAYTTSQRNFGSPHRFNYDPERARALLEEAGCMPCSVTVAISPSGSGQMQPLPMNELMQAQLAAVGFDVTFEVIDWNTMIGVFIRGAVAHPEYDAINFSSATMDPLQFVKSFMKRFQSPGGSNWGGYFNPEVEELLSAALLTFDPAEQDDLIRRAHELVVADAAQLFVVSDLNPRAMAPYVKGFVQAQSWFQDMTPIRVE